jgi:hypothetical protein
MELHHASTLNLRDCETACKVLELFMLLKSRKMEFR